MADDITGRKILILATDGFEQSELEKPQKDLAKAGATVEVASPESGKITGWKGDDWGSKVKVDHKLSDVKAEDYDALVLPGGQINPDKLRALPEAITLIRDFAAAGKPIAAVCHAPWLLIEAGLVNGKRVTGYPTIRTDLKNAGGQVLDESAVVDGNIITSRDPHDLDDFVAAITRALA